MTPTKAALILLAFLLFPATGAAFYPQQPEPGHLRTPAAAWSAALADAVRLPKEICPTIRYLWIPEPDSQHFREASLVCNMISRTKTIARPVPLANGQLIRVCITDYASGKKDFTEWRDTWEEFRYDPKFNLILTRDTVKFLIGELPKVGIWRQEWDGKKQAWEWQWKTIVVSELKDGEIARLPNPEIDAAEYAQLKALLQTESPIVFYPYFVFRALSSVQYKGVGGQVYNGLYIKFAGIPDNETDLLTSLGVDKKTLDRLQPEQRSVMFRSEVTGRQRLIKAFRTLLSVRYNAFVAVTEDPAQGDIDIGQSPIMNLLNFKLKAKEWIYVLPNGLHRYVLTNAEGKLQNEAPIDVVADHTVPRPHPPRLQGAISCISCHEAEGSDGWIPAPNELNVMRKAGINVLGDGSHKNYQLLIDLYKGDFDELFRGGRNDYARAVLEATGPYPDGGDQTKIVQQATGEIRKTYYRFYYDLVTPAQAMRELGYEMKGPDAVKALNLLLPPTEHGAEDPRLGALLAGLSVNRSDFDLSYGFATARIAAGGTRTKVKGK